MLVVEIGDIPDTIRLCRSLQVFDVSSNPLQRCVSIFALSGFHGKFNDLSVSQLFIKLVKYLALFDY